MAEKDKDKNKNKIKEILFTYEAVDKKGKMVKGEIKSPTELVASTTLRKQGLTVKKIKKAGKSGKKITEKDLAVFVRQMAVMMKSGVPLLQSFEIVGKGHSNASMTKMLNDIKTSIETGSSMSASFANYPQYFDKLFCNLLQAGEQAGILEDLLDKLATYKEKTIALKGKIKSALFYPIAVVVASFVITAIIMIFVIPQFKSMFASFGAELPGPTLFVMAVSDFFVTWWWAIFGGIAAAFMGIKNAIKRSIPLQNKIDKYALKVPIFGAVIYKATVARWARTLATMFAAGVPLVEALDSVAGAAGNKIFYDATRQIQQDISTGVSLTVSMQQTNIFPMMMIQMISIGEESGALDGMLNKVADFFEREVDEAVEGLSSLMEPLIMVVLGGLIGTIVVAMYLPIFKMGAAAG